MGIRPDYLRQALALFRDRYPGYTTPWHAYQAMGVSTVIDWERYMDAARDAFRHTATPRPYWRGMTKEQCGK